MENEEKVLLETMNFNHSEKAGTTGGLETGRLSKLEMREPQPEFSFLVSGRYLSLPNPVVGWLTLGTWSCRSQRVVTLPFRPGEGSGGRDRTNKGRNENGMTV